MQQEQRQQQQQQHMSYVNSSSNNNGDDNDDIARMAASYHPLGTRERYLADEALRQHHAVMRERQRQRMLAATCTFHPVTTTTTATSVTRTRAHDDGDDSNNVAAATAAATEDTQTTTAPPAHAPHVSVFARLAAQARERAVRAAQRAAEQQQLQQREHEQHSATFTPHINRNSNSDGGSAAYADTLAQLQRVPVEERLLHYGASVALARQLRRELQAREQAAQMRHGAAHRTSRARHTDAAVAAAVQQQHVGSSRGSRGDDGGDDAMTRVTLHDRLRAQAAFAERNERLLRQRELRRLQAQQEQHARDVTLRPTLCAASVAMVQRVRRDNNNNNNDESDDESDTDSDNGVSHSHTRRRRCDRGVALYEQAMRAKQQQQQQQQQQQHGEGAHRPQTNPLSRAWIAHGVHAPLFARNFVERQELYARVHAAHTSELTQQQCDGGGSGGNTSMSATTTPPRQLTAAELEEHVQRLYTSRALQQQQQRQQQHHYNDSVNDDDGATTTTTTARTTAATTTTRRAMCASAQDTCTFRPTLSPGTRYVLRCRGAQRERDVVKRLTAATTRRSTRTTMHNDDNDARAAHDEDDDADDVSSSSSASSSRARARVTSADVEAFYARQRALLQRRDANAQVARAQADMAAMLACTFRPRINAQHTVQSTASVSARNSNNSNNNNKATHNTGAGGDAEATAAASPSPRVLGVSQFVQRQAAARQLRADAARRLRDVGRGKPVNGPGYTLFTPFVLQTDAQASARRASGVHASTTTAAAAAAGVVAVPSPRRMQRTSAA